MDNDLLTSRLILDRNGPQPLTRQLIDQLKTLILTNQIASGTRLPPTRGLAKHLNLSRTTVLSAYDHLLAEGYVETGGRRGTRVAALAAQALQGLHLAAPKVSRDKAKVRLSRRGQALTAIQRYPFAEAIAMADGAFVTGQSDIRAFPHDIWARCISRMARRGRHLPHGYVDTLGYERLREHIAAHVCQARAVRARVQNTVIVNGMQGALHLLCGLLLDPGDCVWMEDPGYLGARAAFLEAQAEIVPVCVDAAGMCAHDALPAPKLIYVTPSHQYPLGGVLSLRRRLDLLARARRHGAWILEDDYDSEFRHTGSPIAALHGIDTHERVIYLGTFSKTMFAAMRLAFMVLPEGLVEPIGRALSNTGLNAPVLLQAALAEFKKEGHYRAHIRRMRRLYGERRALLIDTLCGGAADRITIAPTGTGLQCAALLAPDVSAEHVARQARARGIMVSPLSRLALSPRTALKYNGLHLGFAAANEETIRCAGAKLCGIISSDQALSANFSSAEMRFSKSAGRRPK